MNEKWYAVYTKQHSERKVAENLTKRKFENYCPLNKIIHEENDKKKITVEPLFTSCVFVRLAEADLISVKKINGIVNFMYWLGRPAVIKAEEIEMIKHILNEYQNVTLGKAKVNINDRVRIIKSPVIEKGDDVITFQNNTVNVILPSLGYQLVAQTEQKNIEVMTISSIERYSAGSFYEAGFRKKYV
jgi:transcription antitermination factor NusG